MKIEISGSAYDWGRSPIGPGDAGEPADLSGIRQVLTEVAALLLPHFDQNIDSVEIRATRFPIADCFGKWVGLSARLSDYHRFRAQFAHELFHILTQKDRLAYPKTPYGAYLVDEILATCASHFAMYQHGAPIPEKSPWVPQAQVRPLNDPYGLNWIQSERPYHEYSGQLDRVLIHRYTPPIAKVLVESPEQWRLTDKLPQCSENAQEFIDGWENRCGSLLPGVPTELITAFREQLL